MAYTIRQLQEADTILRQKLGDTNTSEEEKNIALQQMDVVRQAGDSVRYLLDDTVDHTVSGQAILSNTYRTEMNEIVAEKEREAAKNRTLGEKVSDAGAKFLGGAEAALTLGTGMTTGAASMTLGFLQGVFNNLVDDDSFTSKESQQDIENTMAEYMQMGTFSPKTEEGKEYVQAIGKFLEPLQALAPSVSTPLAGAGRQATNIAGKVLGNASKPAQPFKNVDALETAKQQAKGGTVKSEWVTLAAQTDPKIVKAADDLGILDHLQADHVTTNQAFREVAQISKQIPASKAGVAETLGLEQVANRVEAVVKELGADDLSSVNFNVKNLLEDDLAVLGSEASGLYKQVDELVPRETPINAGSFNRFFDEEVAAVGGLSGVDPSLVKLNKLLNPREGETLTYARLDQARKGLNDGIKDKGQFAGISQSNAKRYSAILSQAQKEAAEAVSPQAGKLYEQANAVAQTKFAVQDDLTSLFGKNLDREIVQPIISGVKDLQKGSVAKLKGVLDRVPESMRNEVLISGLATGMKTNAKNNKPIAFGTFVQLFDGISRNKEARKLILGSLKPEQRKAIMDLYRVSKGISKSLDTKIQTGRLGVGETSRQLQQAASENIMMSVLKAPFRATAKGVTKVIPENSGGTYQYLKEVAEGRSKQVGAVVNDVVGSREFLNVVRSVGTNREEAAIAAFTKLPFFKKIYKNEIKDPKTYIRNAIYGGDIRPQEEKQEE
tara:strand:- start:134 stop:2302 length:2169 start_codon:yes stop_codon:yes gene_type:complete